MYICPNCRATIEKSAQVCAACDAQFGINAHWQPVDAALKNSYFPEKIPNLFNAFSGSFLFLLVGPPIGSFVFLVTHGRGVGLLFLPAAMLLSYSVVGLAAAIAGVVFLALSLFLIFVMRVKVLRAFHGAVLGTISGGVSMWIFTEITSASRLGSSNFAGADLYWIGVISSAIVGGIVTNYKPISRNTDDLI